MFLAFKTKLANMNMLLMATSNQLMQRQQDHKTSHKWTHKCINTKMLVIQSFQNRKLHRMAVEAFQSQRFYRRERIIQSWILTNLKRNFVEAFLIVIAAIMVWATNNFTIIIIKAMAVVPVVKWRWRYINKKADKINLLLKKKVIIVKDQVKMKAIL